MYTHYLYVHTLLSVCLFVCLYPINVKKATESIQILCGTSHDFCKILKIHEKLFIKIVFKDPLDIEYKIF